MGEGGCDRPLKELTMLSSALTYQRLCSKKTGKKYRLPVKKKQQFHVLEVELKALDIDPEEYVKISFRLWEGWCKEREMELVPVNLLCSDAAISRFKELKPVSENDLLRERLIDMEVMLARYVVSGLLAGGCVEERVAAVVQEFPVWWQEERETNSNLYKQAVKEALEHCAFLFRVSFDSTDGYSEIAAKVRGA